MKIFDTHVHTGKATLKIDAVLKALDANKIERMALIAPHSMRKDWYNIRRTVKPAKIGALLRDIIAKEGDRCNRYVADIVKKSKGRIIALARVDQLSDDAPDMLTRAIDMGCTGLKLFQFGHYPEDERCFPTYERCQKLGVNILFHTGILGDGRNSRFHRPANFEIMKNWPRVRCLMAHISWPWTDECIAVADRFKTMARRADGRDPELARDVALRHVNLHDPQYEVPVQCKVDLTPGTPPIYRSAVLKTAYEVLGVDMLIFGTDAYGADDLSGVKTHQDRDEKILREELKLSESDIDRIMGTNVLSVFGEN